MLTAPRREPLSARSPARLCVHREPVRTPRGWAVVEHRSSLRRRRAACGRVAFGCSAFEAHRQAVLPHGSSLLEVLGLGRTFSPNGAFLMRESDPTPTPYIEGTLVEAHQVLCEIGIPEACERAAQLADASAERFSTAWFWQATVRHDLLALDACLWHRVRRNALAGVGRRDGSRCPRTGSWCPGAVSARMGWHADRQAQALPNMLQTDAATLELFRMAGAWPSSRLGYLVGLSKPDMRVSTPPCCGAGGFI